MKWTAKQTAFVVEYVKDWNATQAAIRAGYAKKTAYSAGQALLKKLEVQERIQAIQAEARSSAVMTLAEAQERLSAIARSTVVDFMGKGNRVLVRKGDARALAEFIEDGPKKRVKLHDPVRAIERLGKMLGWDVPEQVEVRIENVNDAKERLAALVGRRVSRGDSGSGGGTE